jgi:hypothetical protein
MKIKMAEAVAKYNRETEPYHRARLAYRLGEDWTSIRVVTPHHVQELEEFPSNPRVSWVLRPPGFSGNEEIVGSVFSWDTKVSVKNGEEILHFKRGSGRSTVGNNTLRHGRINWQETQRSYLEWSDETKRLSEAYYGTLKSIDHKWLRWVWSQNEENREYHQVNRIWYALTRFVGRKTFQVAIAGDIETLPLCHQETFRSLDSVRESYPFFRGDWNNRQGG